MRAGYGMTSAPDDYGGRLDQILAAVGDDQLAATRRMLNPDADDSPMSRVMASM